MIVSKWTTDNLLNLTVRAQSLCRSVRARIAERMAADPEGETGSVSVEQAVITGLLVVLGITVVTIIGKKVVDFAGSINLNGGGQP